MTNEEREKILGKTDVKELFYRLDDYKYSNASKERVLSGIAGLDKLISGFELGCISIWTGKTNMGKTSIMTMLAKKSIEQGERIFFFNGEQTKEDFKNNLYIQASTEKDLVSKQFRNSCVFDTFITQEKAYELEKLYGNKIFIYNNECNRDIDTLLYAMEEVRRREKIRVFFLDNFMQIDIKSDNIYQEQSNIMEKLRTFAVNKKVHIHLVAHPRKTEKSQTRLDLFDIAGSSNLTNKAYNIISIMRLDNVRKNPKEYEKLEMELMEEGYDLQNVSTVLEVLKTKGKECGIVALKYNPQFKTFSETNKLSKELIEKNKHKNNKKNEMEMDLPW